MRRGPVVWKSPDCGPKRRIPVKYMGKCIVGLALKGERCLCIYVRAPGEAKAGSLMAVAWYEVKGMHATAAARIGRYVIFMHGRRVS